MRNIRISTTHYIGSPRQTVENNTKRITTQKSNLFFYTMTCSVAIAASSPAAAFSPSHCRLPLTCKTSSSTSSPDALTIANIIQSASDGSPSSTSPIKSPFRSSRFSRGPIALLKSSPSPSSPSCSAIRSGSVLKRKRPAMIDIPLADDLIFAPVGSDGRKEVEMESVRCSVYCKRGRKRVEMEDRFKVDLDVDGDPQLAFFGIFDGHGGTKAAEFAAENMGENIVAEAMAGDGSIEAAVANGYLKTDSEFLKEETASGSCCVTALVKNGDLVVSNAGDCRAVLSVSGAAAALTSDHRPSREDERERIESLGGYVDFCRGLWRLQGALAVSRGIGDAQMKQWVIPNPETRVLAIRDEFEFLVLASDGLWDRVSNQEAVDVARPFCVDPRNPSPMSACKKLADLSASRGSTDDISVMIIQLKHFV